MPTIVRRYHERGGQPAIAYGDRPRRRASARGRLRRRRSAAGQAGARRADGVPHRVDVEVVHRVRRPAAARRGSACARRPGRDVRARAGRLGRTGRRTPAAVTIRHLLTMTAGFPTDDPWGDRQQGLPLDAFDALLAGGVAFNWAPGTRFEYSNLGLRDPRQDRGGRVAACRTTSSSATRLLAPLGMTRTGFDADEFDRRRAGDRLPARPGGLGRSCRSTRTARSPRWAACSPASRPRDAGSAGLRGGVPARRRLRRRRATAPAAQRRRGGRCSCRRR